MLPLLLLAVQFDIVPESSAIAVRTDKSGLLSTFAGHRHGIIATEFTARICADPQTLAPATVAIRIPTRALRIDTPDARRAASLSGSPPGSKDVATVQEKMLAPANLAAAEHPEIRFESSAAERKGDTLVVRGPLTIRGRAQNISVPLRVQQTVPAWRFSGEFRVRQSDFGIAPESIAGVVKVVDEVTIVIDVAARPTQTTCK